jgi:hypothetical protein
MKTHTHKRFLLFVYSDYYPQGGMDDLEGNFDKAIEAVEAIGKITRNFDNAVIYDRVEGLSFTEREYLLGKTIYTDDYYVDNY